MSCQDMVNLLPAIHRVAWHKIINIARKKIQVKNTNLNNMLYQVVIQT